MKDIYQVIKKVRISEKATMAVEVAFGKKVASVRTANYDGKLKRQRRSDAGRTAHWKKAYVKLANGETLDLV